jgi:predicted ester cyclase
MTELSPLAELLRTYAYGYTASHDFTVCDQIMVEDYVLHMNAFSLRGRDEQYKPATAKQYRQFPGLGFTVHGFISNGERAALHFTEHGRSVLSGTSASWQGVSMYRWDHERLTECRVEQDYYSRAAQQQAGVPLPVSPPALDPFMAPDEPASPHTEDVVRTWLESSLWMDDSEVSWDDATADVARARIDAPSSHVIDLFSAGSHAAFHVSVSGAYAGGLGEAHDALRGVRGDLYATGLVQVADGRVTGHVVTDRHTYLRRLTATA